MAEQARINLEKRNITQATTKGVAIKQARFRPKCLSRYHENKYPFPDLSDESSPPAPSLTDSTPDVTVTKSKSLLEITKFGTGSAV